MKRSLYDVLQVSSKADQDVIEAAYTRLIQKHQSQLTPEADNEIKFINHAYETLADPAKRVAYDEKLATETFSYQPIKAQEVSSFTPNSVWDSPIIRYSILFLLATLGVKLYFTHNEEQEKLKVSSDLTQKHLDNEKTLVEGAVNNQSKAIDNSANTANNMIEAARLEAERRSIDAEIRRQQAELDRQTAQEAMQKRMEEQRKAREQQMNTMQAQQSMERERQALFSKLMSEHRYREAQDFAKSPGEVAMINQMIQADYYNDIRQNQMYERRQALENYNRINRN